MSALVWQRSGSGFPLVFVHGYLGGADIWKDQTRHFAKKFEVLVPNLPGFGASSKLKGPNTIKGFATAILNDLQEFGIKLFHLVGHSMGGMIAQTMAALVPQMVPNLVCYGTGPVGAMPDRFEKIATSRARLHADGLDITAKRIAATWFMKGDAAAGYPLCAKLGLQANLQAADAALEAMEMWDGRAKLPDIKANTLVVWGDHDRSYSWAQPEALWRGIENCALAVMPNCAHNAHLEKPELFTCIVEDFLPKRTV